MQKNISSSLIRSSNLKRHLEIDDNLITTIGRGLQAHTKQALNQNNVTNHAYSNQINIPTNRVTRLRERNVGDGSCNPHITGGAGAHFEVEHHRDYYKRDQKLRKLAI
ncbi:unnamed protein product [Gordionus sp. m RMFG-2023]